MTKRHIHIITKLREKFEENGNKCWLHYFIHLQINSLFNNNNLLLLFLVHTHTHTHDAVFIFTHIYFGTY